MNGTRKRHTPGQIEVAIANGKTTPAAARVVQATDYGESAYFYRSFAASLRIAEDPETVKLLKPNEDAVAWVRLSFPDTRRISPRTALAIAR
jgi:hypothetical protein